MVTDIQWVKASLSSDTLTHLPEKHKFCTPKPGLQWEIWELGT